MRIAYVTETHPPEVNGVSLTVAHTLHFLRERGHDIDLIRPRQPHEAACDQPAQWRTRALSVPMKPALRLGLAGVAQLRRRFEQHRPDVVHMATAGPLAWAAMRAALALQIPATTDWRVPLGAKQDGWPSWWSPLVLKARRGFHNQGQRTFVPTPATQRTLSACGFEQLEVLSTGVDTQAFSPTLYSPALRDELAHPDGPLLLYRGPLTSDHRAGLALQAYEAVRVGMPQASMVVMGDGPQRAALEGAHPHAQFVGTLPAQAQAQHLACADVLLLPNMADTCEQAMLEALASGVPVLTFHTDSAAMLVHDGGAGKVVPAGDAEHFIAAACALAWQYRHLKPMRECARQVALRRKWEQVLLPFENRLLALACAVTPAQLRQTRAA
ncbi:MAG: glycosyltransferase [Aquabacterium sp.]